MKDFRIEIAGLFLKSTNCYGRHRLYHLRNILRNSINLCLYGLYGHAQIQRKNKKRAAVESQTQATV
jgi:hypothetical protein